jgi:hypothetical protein
MIQATLNTFPPGFRADGRFQIRVDAPPQRPDAAPTERPLTGIDDARALQGDADVATFFAAHGFVLLPHATQVTDWSADPSDRYHAEIEDLIRTRLLPGRTLVIPPFASIVRRGGGSGNGYAGGVHQDCGIGPDDYEHLVGAFAGPQAATGWRTFYDRPDVEAFMVIDFWRVTDMAAPLRHMPLAVCDPASVDPDDTIPTEIYGVAPEGRPLRNLGLRRNAAQHWYYYPGMTNDEVLAFKLFDCRKAYPAAFRSCFHTAFADPTAPADAEPRKSAEFRVGVFILRD